MYWVNGLYVNTVGGVNYFQSANPGAGIPKGTQVTTAWLNDMQGENLNFLAAAGITPLPGTPTQVKAATDFLYGFKYGILTANKVVAAADRGTIFTCNTGCSTVTLPAASGFDTGFVVGFGGGGGAPTTINVSIQVNDGEALSGESSFVLAFTSSVLLQAQGVNWGVIASTPDVATTSSVSYALLAGSSSQVFSVAPATVGTEALAASQAIGGLSSSVSVVTGSRALGTVYTNSTGRPLQVIVSTGGSGTGGATAYVNGTAVGGYSNGGNRNIAFFSSFIVPAGMTYEVVSTGNSLNEWTEI